MPALSPMVKSFKPDGALSDTTSSTLAALERDLRQARADIERTLLKEEAFRALQQLDAREQSGSPVSAIASSDLRRHLIKALRHPGDYHAMAQIDAAIAALAGDLKWPQPAAVAPQSAEPAPAFAPAATESDRPAVLPEQGSQEPASGTRSGEPVAPPPVSAAAAVARAFSAAFRRADPARPTSAAVATQAPVPTVAPVQAPAPQPPQAAAPTSTAPAWSAPVPIPSPPPAWSTTVPVEPAKPEPPAALAVVAAVPQLAALPPVPGTPSAHPAPHPAAPPSSKLRDALHSAEAAVFASVARLKSDAPVDVPAPRPTAPAATVAPVPVVPAPPPAPLPAPVAHFTVPEGPALAPEPQPVLPERLERIRGIDTAMAARLQQLGVQRFAQIANWGPLDVEYVRRALGPDALISRHNWIEQAAILAQGRLTRYARAVDAGIENTDRRLPAEPPPRRVGTPLFYRVGLPGGPAPSRSSATGSTLSVTPIRTVAMAPLAVAAAVPASAARPTGPQPQPQPVQRPQPAPAAAAAPAPAPQSGAPQSGAPQSTRPEPFATRLQPPFGRSEVTAARLAPNSDTPMASAQAHNGAAAARPSAPAPTVARTPFGRPAPERADVSADLNGDWADVTIVARPTAEASSSYLPGPAPAVLAASLGPTTPLDAVSVRRPAGPMRSTLADDHIEDEATVEIRRYDAPSPPPGRPQEPTGFGRLLKALKPGDRI